MKNTAFDPEDYESNERISWSKNYIWYPIIVLTVLYIPLFASKILPGRIWFTVRDITIGFIIGVIFCAYRFSTHKYRKKP